MKALDHECRPRSLAQRSVEAMLLLAILEQSLVDLSSTRQMRSDEVVTGWRRIFEDGSWTWRGTGSMCGWRGCPSGMGVSGVREEGTALLTVTPAPARDRSLLD